MIQVAVERIWREECHLRVLVGLCQQDKMNWQTSSRWWWMCFNCVSGVDSEAHIPVPNIPSFSYIDRITSDSGEEISKVFRIADGL